MSVRAIAICVSPNLPVRLAAMGRVQHNMQMTSDVKSASIRPHSPHMCLPTDNNNLAVLINVPGQSLCDISVCGTPHEHWRDLLCGLCTPLLFRARCSDGYNMPLRSSLYTISTDIDTPTMRRVNMQQVRSHAIANVCVLTLEYSLGIGLLTPGHVGRLSPCARIALVYLWDWADQFLNNVLFVVGTFGCILWDC